MTKFPPLADTLRQASAGKIDLRLKPKPDLPDEAIDDNARKLGKQYGASTSIEAASAKSEPLQTAPLTSVRFDCPNYLDKALAVRAAEEGVTKTYLILKALGDAGYRLDEADLVKDRRRQRK